MIKEHPNENTMTTTGDHSNRELEEEFEENLIKVREKYSASKDALFDKFSFNPSTTSSKAKLPKKNFLS